MSRKSTKSSKLLTPTRLSGDSMNSSPGGTSKLKKLTGGKTGTPSPRSRALKKKTVQKAIAKNQVLAVLKNGLTIKSCSGACCGKKCEGNCGNKGGKTVAKSKGKTGTVS